MFGMESRITIDIRLIVCPFNCAILLNAPFLGGQNSVKNKNIVSSQNYIILYFNEERKKHLQSISILAKLSPSNKLLMVGILKEMGEAIFVIGHGIDHALTIQEVDVRASRRV